MFTDLGIDQPDEDEMMELLEEFGEVHGLGPLEQQRWCVEPVAAAAAAAGWQERQRRWQEDAYSEDRDSQDGSGDDFG